MPLSNAAFALCVSVRGRNALSNSLVTCQNFWAAYCRASSGQMGAKAATQITCKNCRNVVPAYVDRCVVCGSDVGYPNVRMASSDAEVDALEKRVERAYESASAGGSSEVLKRFETFASGTQAVMVRDLRQLDTFVHFDNAILATYHSAVRGQARLPEENDWDPRRPSVDSAINPYFYDKIHYAALSGDGFGASSYGGYHILFREQDICLRTTVFEENGFVFLDRQTGNRVPPGHRASWAGRSQLVIAKLHAKILSDTEDSNFPGILLEQGTAHGSSDFVEVHIYGSIHRRAIVAVRGPRPTDEGDVYVWSKIKRSLESVGAEVAEI